MPRALRKLSQLCSVHPRTGKLKAPVKFFRPDQGKFITDHKRGTVFVCFDCLRKEYKSKAKRSLVKRSSPQHDVYNDFDRAGIKFKYEYHIDKWPFDFAFPELRLLIEIDDPLHDTKQGKSRDFFKTKFAEEQGWTVKRVKTGPDLTARCLTALRQHKEAIGAVVTM